MKEHAIFFEHTLEQLCLSVSVCRYTGEAVNATANELGKNASDIGSTILNKTVEVGKKIVGGVADV